MSRRMSLSFSQDVDPRQPVESEYEEGDLTETEAEAAMMFDEPESTEESGLLADRGHGRSATERSGSSSRARGEGISWHKRVASPKWLVAVIFMMNLSRGMITAPKVEVYTLLACRRILPELSSLLEPTIGVMATPKQCLENTSVQRLAASLQATVNTTMAVLCTLTAGRWGRYSDENGRKKVIFLTMLGATISDLLFLGASRTKNWHYGRLLLIASPIIEGSLGGVPTFTGVTHAYISDCTPHGSRSTTFAWLQGVLYVGLSSGPEVAGAVLHFVKSSTVTTIFIVNLINFGINLFYIAFILPESVPLDVIRKASQERAARPRDSGSLTGLFKRAWSALMKFFLPVTLFLPSRPQGVIAGRRDWNLTYFALGLFAYELTLGLYAVKYLYAKHIFGWGAEELGYYVSYFWAIRAIYLLGIMPALIRRFKPKHSSPPSETSNRLSPAFRAELKFDVIIARCSYAADLVSNFLVTTGPSHSAPYFVAATTITAFSSGAIPVMYSLSASLLHSMGSSHAIGQLYGAIAVISAVSHAIQPGMYAAVFGSTIATFPRAIFVMTGVLNVTTLFFLAFIRPKVPVGFQGRASEGAEEVVSP